MAESQCVEAQRKCEYINQGTYCSEKYIANGLAVLDIDAVKTYFLQRAYDVALHGQVVRVLGSLGG